MTDLIDRIRAYVAEMPTHHCFQCSEDIAQVDGGCPNCGENWIPQKLTESHALALLREVAALEPVAHVSRDEFREEDVTDWKPWPIQSRNDDVALYTLTGATHD